MTPMYRDEHDLSRDMRTACVHACNTCAEVCNACADACLGEPEVAELVRCIRTNLDCADMCATAGEVLDRFRGDHPELVRAVLDACAIVAAVCAEECRMHADRYAHCKAAADACDECATACAAMLREPALL
ncbi:four-helix bundle copper-binding protein [Catellatospora tritici]|uniref:four-helix bundle copper-binding protein n=1 Tax=Catellatospora tritici TaxID=2851566 RepID=UPI001C2D953D|nr:four-helix bundle copper-binding protein [Catellatospora tritici]MBV1852818.1 four-helix bundle copper-binding protein [Catellatospora tritici]